ncbi:MAG: DNA translocase FtsK 4TM domain-containing protein, partial [Planctomycetaceae bacterium]|nr:DNA translocase FtsK 4TM domain-containing protein [Planctomycetaceae bacterium]
SLVSFHPADPPAAMTWPPVKETRNLCGEAGAQLAHALRVALGHGSWFVLYALVVTDMRLFSRRSWHDAFWRMSGWGLSLVALCTGLQKVLPELDGGAGTGSGGYTGSAVLMLLAPSFSSAGTTILIVSTFLAGMMLWNEFRIFRRVFRLLFFPLIFVLRLRKRRKAKRLLAAEQAAARAAEQADQDPGVISLTGEVDGSDEEEEDEAPGDVVRQLSVHMPGEDSDAELTGEGPDEEDAPVVLPPVVVEPRTFHVNPPVGASLARQRMVSREPAANTAFVLPDVDLLEPPEDFPYEELAERARIAAATLEEAFQNFGLNVHVSEIDTGPVVTQFELELEAGLRLSKITSLADDLAIALRVPAVRVVAPIPGKNTVGVEVPNDTRVMVRLRELIEVCGEQTAKMSLPIFVGKDVSGHPLMLDLARMPHLLIAGRTGTGKSVCLNALILSLLMTRTPDEVRMLMIDPKMVELSPYMRVPHLMHPVITDMKKAEAVLAWAVDKMEERYDLLARCGVRHLDSYNKLGKEEVLNRLGIDAEDPERMLEAEQIPERMPYIVIIADEMADMMMTSGKDVEAHIIRLAQKSRAVGIHLVLATQKPTVDVLTGLIKSNLPARVSFQVASRTDSRVVLDEMGAERLLGNGDMLYLAPGTSNICRAQGAFVSDEEVNRVIDFYGDYGTQYSNELAQVGAQAAAAGGAGVDVSRQRDELYEQAVEVVIREGRGSVSLLQRALGVGYGRGARLIDYMAEDGIVGDYNGSQARDVLLTMEQWQDLAQGQTLVGAAD